MRPHLDSPDRTIDPPRVGLPVVFLGPTLPVAEAASLVEAEFRPPICRGDLGTVDPARTVLIIDGEFDQSLPVSPKEIVRALDAGMVVLGAASMGALRAAEVGVEGMIGIGRIFEAYRSGAIEGDDEVALSYCPLSFEPWTVPLVNVRFWLDGLRADGLATDREWSTCFRRARQVFYADRTPARLAEVLDAALGVARARSFRDAGLGIIPDAKAADARAALAALARMVESFPPSPRRHS